MQVRQSIQRKLSHIPPSVIEHFAADNKVVCLNLGHPDAVAQYAGIYRFPVEVGELDESLVADLKQSGFRINSTDGTVSRGDCLLFAVDRGTQESLDDDAAVAFAQQKVAQNEEMADQLNAQVSRATGGHAGVEAVKGRHVRDHVIHGGR